MRLQKRKRDGDGKVWTKAIEILEGLAFRAGEVAKLARERRQGGNALLADERVIALEQAADQLRAAATQTDGGNDGGS